MAYLAGVFEANGLPQDGVTASLYASSSLSAAPQKGTSLPATGLLQSTTTGPQHGGSGAWRFSVTTGDYFVGFSWAGTTVWESMSVGQFAGMAVDTMPPSGGLNNGAPTGTSTGTPVAPPAGICLDVGSNRVPNPEFVDGAAGWTLSNFSVASAAGSLTQFETNAWLITPGSPSAGTICTATATTSPKYTTDGRDKGRAVTLSCLVKIPDSSWTVQLQLDDGGSTPSCTVPAAYQDGFWHRVNCQLTISNTATRLNFKVKATVGSGLGQAYIAAPTLSYGGVPLTPHTSPRILPRRFAMQGAYVPASPVALDGTFGAYDPTTLGPFIKVIGASGAVTYASNGSPLSQPTGGNGDLWSVPDGAIIYLVGTDDTRTITLTNSTGVSAGPSYRLGASTRVLAKHSVLQLYWDSADNCWHEISFRS